MGWRRGYRSGCGGGGGGRWRPTIPARSRWTGARGRDAAANVAVLRAQPGVFGGGRASDPTVSRLITTLAGDIDAALAAITTARAAARERVWQHGGAPTQDGQVVIDLDATLVLAHSDKEDATLPTKTRGRCFPSTKEKLAERGRHKRLECRIEAFAELLHAI